VMGRRLDCFFFVGFVLGEVVPVETTSSRALDMH